MLCVLTIKTFTIVFDLVLTRAQGCHPCKQLGVDDVLLVGPEKNEAKVLGITWMRPTDAKVA